MTRGKWAWLVSLAVLAGSAWWLPRSNWLGGRLRVPIEEGLSKATGRVVSVGGVGLGLSGWVWLQDVSVGPDPRGLPLDLSFTVKALGLRLDRWALMRGQADLSTLEVVKLRAPSFYVLHGAPQGATPAAGSTLTWDQWPLPPVEVDLSGGEAWEQAQHGGLRHLAGALKLDLQPHDNGFAGRLRGEPEGGGSATLWIQRAGPAAALELRLRADGMGLAPWLDQWQKGHGLSQGRLSGELQAEAQPGQAPADWSMKGQGKLQGLAWGLEGQPVLFKGLDGQWSSEGKRLRLEGLKAELAGAVLKGGLTLDLERKTLEGQAAVAGADLKELSQALGQAGLGIEGSADFDAGLAGPLSATALSAQLHSRGAHWQGRELKAAELSLSWIQGKGRVQGDLGWEQGHGKVEAAWQGGRLLQATIDTKALPAAWLQAWVSGPWEGTVDLGASFKGEGLPWDLTLKADQVRWKAQLLRSLSFNINGNKKAAHLRLDADLERWQRLRAVADAERDSSGRWAIKRAKVTQGERLLAQGQGQWSPQAAAGQEQAGFSASLSALPLAPFMAGTRWQDLSGTAQGEAEGVYRDGAWTGTARLEAAALRSAAGDFDARADLRFAPGSVSVSAFSLRGEELRGSASARQLSGPWDLELRLKQASLPALARLASGSTQGLSGTATGSLAWDGASASGRAKASLEEPLPAWIPGAKASFEVALAKDLIDLQSLELAQGQGRLQARGRWDLSGKESGQGEAHWKGLLVRGMKSEGQAKLEARTLSVGPWSLSSTALAPLGLQVTQAPEGRRLALSWGALQLHALWQGQPEGQARWSAQASDKQAVGSALNASGAQGPSGWAWSAELKAWDLARVSSALAAALGSDPGLKGLVQAKLEGGAGKVQVQAKVPRFSYDKTDLGPLALNGQWKEGGLSVDDLRLGDSGLHAWVKQARWQPLDKGWWAGGQMGLQGLEMGPSSLGFEGDLSITAKEGQLKGSGRFAKLVLGLRTFKGLGLDFEKAQARWSLREPGKKPAFKAEGDWSPGLFVLRALQSNAGKGVATLKGSVGPGERMDFEGSATAYPLSDLAQAMGWEQEWTGLAFGSLKVSGTLDKPLTTVSVKAEDGSVQGLPFDLASAVVQADDQWADLSPIQPIRLSRKNGVALEVGGKVPLATDTDKAPDGLDVWAELRQGGLGLFSGFGPIHSGEGPLELQLRFTGRRDDPQVRGKLQVQGGKITPAWLLPGLDNVDIYARLEDGRVELDKAQARIAGDGPLLKLELADEQRPAFVLDHWLPTDFNLRLRSSKSGLPARTTPQLRFLDGTLHPDLRLSGSWDEPRLEGTVSVDKGLADKAVLVWPPQWTPPLSEDGDNFSDRVLYAVKVYARQDVMVRTEAAQAFVDTGEAGLALSGSGDAVQAQGRIRARQGSVDYLLTNFQLATDRETYIDLRGEDPPRLEIWGIKRVRRAIIDGETLPRDVEVRLHAFGELGSVQMRLESEDQQLRQDQLASLVGLGTDASDPRNQGGFARLLGRVPAGLLTNIARRSGLVDEVGVRLPGVENMLTGSQSTPGPGESAQDPRRSATPVSGTGKSLVEVNVGKYVGEKVYVGVKTGLDERVGEGGKTSLEPAVGGKVEVEIKDNTRVSAEHNVDPSGKSEQKFMVETSKHFGNYDPRKRRWKELSPTPTPTPRPAP